MSVVESKPVVRSAEGVAVVGAKVDGVAVVRQPPDEAANKSLEERRELLERRANVIRSRLLRTIDALDVRRHQVAALGREAKRLALPIVAGVVGAAVVGIGVTLAVRAAIKSRRERRIEYRIATALEPLRQERKPSFALQLAQRVAMTVIGIVASELAKRSARRALDGRVPSGRLVVGEASDGQGTYLVTR